MVVFGGKERPIGFDVLAWYVRTRATNVEFDKFGERFVRFFDLLVGAYYFPFVWSGRGTVCECECVMVWVEYVSTVFALGRYFNKDALFGQEDVFFG